MPSTLRLAFHPYSSGTPFIVEVLSVSFDAQQTLNIGSQSTGAGAGKVVFNPFSFTKKPDSHSAEFWLRLCNGTPFQRVTLEIARPTGDPRGASPYFSFTMGLVAIKTISFSSADGGDSTVESVTVEYGQAAYSVTPQNPDGSLGKPVATGWDRVKNVAVDPAKVGA